MVARVGRSRLILKSKFCTEDNSDRKLGAKLIKFGWLKCERASGIFVIAMCL